MLKSAVLTGAQPVLAPEDLIDLDHRVLDGVLARRPARRWSGRVAAHHAELRGGQRDVEALVRVGEALRALLRQHANDLEGHAADPDRLAHAATRWRRHRAGCPPGRPARRPGAGPRSSASVKSRPAASWLLFTLEVGGPDADDGQVGVARAVLDLHAALQLGRDGLDVARGRSAAPPRPSPMSMAWPRPTPPAKDWPGAHGEHVGAQRLQPGLHRALSALAQGHHGDDRRDANHHAQHGEQRAQLVGDDRVEGDQEDLQDQHGRPLPPAAAHPATTAQRRAARRRPPAAASDPGSAAAAAGAAPRRPAAPSLPAPAH